MLAFAGAGLSTPIEELLDHPGATFLRRAEHHTIGPVSRSDVRTALAQTIADGDREIDVHALDRAADAAAGHPFMIQLGGYYTLKNAAPTGRSEERRVGNERRDRSSPATYTPSAG